MSQILRWPPGWQPQPKISHLDARPYFNLDSVSTAVFRELMAEARLFLVFKAGLYKLNPRWFQRWQSHCYLTTGEISPQYELNPKSSDHPYQDEALLKIIKEYTMLSWWQGQNIWVTARQNQQNYICTQLRLRSACAQQHGLIRVFAVQSVGRLCPIFSSYKQLRLIRLGRCPGWFESSLGAQVILFVLSCSSSFVLDK